VARLRERAPVVTVAGDAILDGWWIGRTSRLSREAPAPVLESAELSWAAGGAANTAVNLAALGARVRFVGAVGPDAAGRRLRALLETEGVDASGLLVDPLLATPRKIRVLAEDQLLVRIDDGRAATSPQLDRRLREAIDRAAEGSRALVLCDYGSALWSDPLRDSLARALRRPPLVIVDAHDLRRWRALRPDVVTPNFEEAAALIGAEDESDRPRLVERGRAALLTASGARSAAVTLDREGALLVGEEGVGYRTHAHPELDRRATGAGDTFTAALALALAGGEQIGFAMELAQLAADVVVRRLGTTVCRAADLDEQLGEAARVAPDPEPLRALLEKERARGRRIVFTNGCFDVLHRGHTSYLRQAKRLGDVLVVAVNSDAGVRRLKGPGRPVNPEEDRAAVLAALDCVDHVIVFDTDTPTPLLELLHPDVYAKGGDYSADMLAEAEVVRGYGGEVRILDYVADHSTTSIVERIRTGAP